MGNCDTHLVLAFQDPESARVFSDRADALPSTLMATPIDRSWLFVRGRTPEQVERFRLEDHPLYGELPEAQRGHAEALNVVLVGDHGMTEVHTNLTSTLSDVLDAVGIPYENAAVNIGPFREDTKLVYNLASGSAEIYFRKPLTQAEYDALIAGLEGITGVARVYTRSELDAMDTPQNLGDLVVDCAEGYAFPLRWQSMAQRRNNRYLWCSMAPRSSKGSCMKQNVGQWTA